MRKLKLIVAQEYRTDITGKSFWITTLILPLLFIGFSVFIGVMSSESESMMQFNKSTSVDTSHWGGVQVLGLMCGVFLTLFLTMYGSQIFNKVKVEKCNRIAEVLATCVDGRTMMLAKIISVGLIGLTQFLIWALFTVLLLFGIVTLAGVEIPYHYLADSRVVLAIIWTVAFFIGGYVFFGSLFAAVGAMTDKNNENQEYMAVLTLALLISFYVAQYAVDNGTSLLARICTYVPFTSPTVGAVNAITGTSPWWMSLLTLAILYLFAIFAVSMAGKIYKSSLLLKGTRFSLRDIAIILKAK